MEEAELRKDSSRKELMQFVISLLKNKEFFFGFIIVSIFVLTALVVSLTGIFHLRITPYDPIAQNVGPSLEAPSLRHFFGTDIEGRDLFSRIVAATSGDLGVSFGVIGMALLIGALVGS